MTKEELINLILEKYDNVKISKMKSYKKYNDFAKLDKSFFSTLNNKQIDLYLLCEDAFMDYLLVKEKELVEFVLDFIKCVNQL